MNEAKEDAEKIRKDAQEKAEKTIKDADALAAKKKELGEKNLAEANAKALTKPGTKLMAIIKADAYGHGAVPIAAMLEKNKYVYKAKRRRHENN